MARHHASMGCRLRSGRDSDRGQQHDTADPAGFRDVEDVLWVQQVGISTAVVEEQRVSAVNNGPKALRVGQVGLPVPHALRHGRVRDSSDTAVTCSPGCRRVPARVVGQRCRSPVLPLLRS